MTRLTDNQIASLRTVGHTTDDAELSAMAADEIVFLRRCLSYAYAGMRLYADLFVAASKNRKTA